MISGRNIDIWERIQWVILVIVPSWLGILIDTYCLCYNSLCQPGCWGITNCKWNGILKYTVYTNILFFLAKKWNHHEVWSIRGVFLWVFVKLGPPTKIPMSAINDFWTFPHIITELYVHIFKAVIIICESGFWICREIRWCYLFHPLSDVLGFPLPPTYFFHKHCFYA